jgi:hypothetical protein
MAKYEVVEHTDVWGSDEEGWFVNDSRVWDGYINIPNDCEDLKKFIVREGFVANGDIDIEDFADCFAVNGLDGYPIYTFYYVEE